MTAARGLGVICLAVFRPDPVLLRRQIESIRAQTEHAWVCHIGIDGRDAAAEANVSATVGGDARFVIHSYEQNVGFYRNFERLLGEVGDQPRWVALSDQDDYWYPNKLSELGELLATTGAALASAQARIVDALGEPVGSSERRRQTMTGLLLDNQVTGSFSVMRHDVVDRALPFPEPTDAAYHDHWLGVIAMSSGGVIFSTHPLQDYVQHGSNVIGEAKSESSSVRVRRLFSSGRSIRNAAEHLAAHRWEWRVRIAQEAIRRVPDLDRTAYDELTRFAQDRFSLALFRNVTLAVVRRQAPAARSAAILVGAVASRASRIRPATSL